VAISYTISRDVTERLCQLSVRLLFRMPGVAEILLGVDSRSRCRSAQWEEFEEWNRFP
jgi:hypothetical protein